MKTPDNKTILELAYTYPEIGTKEIARLYDISDTAALVRKKKVQKVMAERGIHTWDPRNVPTKLAFEVLKIDLAEAERSYTKLIKLGLATAGEETQ